MSRAAAKALLLLIAGAGIVAAQTATATAGGSNGNAPDANQLEIRALQLMESTAVAVPGLTRASESVKQSADTLFAGLQRAPRDPALMWRFMSQVKAYVALFDSFPRPDPFPPAADQQIAELRENLERLQQYFTTLLTVQNQAVRQRDSDPNNLKRYAEADKKMLPASKAPRIVFLGDSITEGWRLNEYFTGRDFVNRGIGDQTTLQMLARFEQDVVALSPKAVVILAGTNDIATGIAAGQIEDDLMTMGDVAKAHGITPVFASILPVSDYHKDADPAYAQTSNRPPATIQAVNQWLRNWCQTQGFVYLDFHTPMADTAGYLQADLSDDGLHPNAKGYRVMSPVTLEGIGRALAGKADDSVPARRRKSADR